MSYLRLASAASNRLRSDERVWLGLALWLALALRAYQLGTQAIWWDESLSVYRATRDLLSILSNTIIFQNTVTIDTLPPFYFILLHPLVAALGTSEFALRYLSLAANVASLPLLYVLGRRWFSKSVGVIAALLGALAPFYVAYAQEARPYALLLFESLLALYALSRAFPRAGGADLSRRWLVVYVGAATASLYTHYLAVFFVPLHVVLIALHLPRPHSPRQALQLLWPAVPLVASVPLIPIIRASMAGNAGMGPGYVPLWMILRDLLNSFTVGISVDLNQAAGIDAVFLLVLLAGLVAAFRSRRSAGVLLAAYLVLPVLGLQAASLYRPLYLQSRYLIGSSPAFYLGVAVGILALARRARLAAAVALVLFLIGAIFSLNNLYFDLRYAKDDHRAWAEYLQEHVRPGDFLILDSPHTEALYEYYAGDVVPWVSLPVLRNAVADSPAADLAAVRGALDQHARVWFLEMQVPFDDPTARIEKLLNQEGLLLDQVRFAGTSTELSLSLYAPSLPTAAAGAVPHPLTASFGPQLQLVGYDAPPTVQVGARAQVKLYWQLAERVGEDLAVSLRLVAPGEGDGGNPSAQYDAVLVGHFAGSSTWPAEKTIVDTHDLPAAVGTRPGTYELQATVYHTGTGDALAEPITLGRVEVTRPSVPIDPNTLQITRVEGSAGGLRLLGGNWQSSPVQPGDVVPVEVYFQVIGKPDADVGLVLEFAQRLFPLIGPATPRATGRADVTARDLQAGDIVRQELSVRVPPDAGGDYMLRLAIAGAPAVALGDVHIQPRPRAANAPAIPHPFAARLGESIDLLGYDVSTASLHPGETLRLTLYWRARQSMETSYKVFTHVIDAGNQILGQRDGIPVGETRPTTGWAPGEVIVDSYSITLTPTAPPGSYPVEVGFYDPISGARLPTFDASGAALGDRILLPAIEVR